VAYVGFEQCDVVLIERANRLIIMLVRVFQLRGHGLRLRLADDSNTHTHGTRRAFILVASVLLRVRRPSTRTSAWPARWSATTAAMMERAATVAATAT